MANAAGPAFEIEGLDELKAVVDYRYLYVTPTNTFMHAVGAALRQAAARVSPKGRTKKYSRSWVEVYGGGKPPETVRVENTDEPKATFIALGTPAHVIEPVNKKALFWEGARHPVRRVFHPGTKPNDVAAKAQLEAQSEIEGQLVPAWEADMEARFNKRAA